MQTLNLGILAHVDAGKTSLTERLLFAAGVIDEIGSVDNGNTQTDSLALERQRGITIKSAVAAFSIASASKGSVTVNLIDTPGHPDFIAEVERVLGVLDGAVLVISAVEGVQAQTRILMRTLRRLNIPTLIFVNKIDRSGARQEGLLDEISAKLGIALVPMGTASLLGTARANFTTFPPNDESFARRLTELLAETDDALLTAYVENASVSARQLRRKLVAQVASAQVHPVFFGSATTGAGVDSLISGVAELLPTAQGSSDAPLSGSVFKIERGSAGEKIAYARVFTGQIHPRDKVRFGAGGEAKVTAMTVFGADAATAAGEALPGQIAKLWGLADVRVGDELGCVRHADDRHHFAPPTLETVVVPTHRSDRIALHAALVQLAEQDPLINLRLDDERQETLLSLYGEVQKEVIQATLTDDYRIGIRFLETTTLCVEQVLGSGSAAEFMGRDGNPFRATVGLRVDPALPGEGVTFRLEVELGSMPAAFMTAVEDTVRETLRQGVYGWQVLDCTVTLTHTGYTPPPPYGWSKWSSSASDFRNLTPLVLMTALQQARTVVCEPISEFAVEIPADCLAQVLAALARLGAVGQAPELEGPSCVIRGEIQAGVVHDFQLQLPGLTRGEGVVETAFARYQPVRGEPPVRARTDHNPLKRKDYLLRVRRGVA
ncbi:MAG TPA: translation factor GTPase family protein [Streptosporangiaceae bacterium]|nr:translation factor GTPase family protein [Streptosporangiaceae bacterium]